MQTLIARYDRIGRDGRPVLNAARAVEVNYSLALIQMDLNEKQKILSMSMWTRYVRKSFANRCSFVDFTDSSHTEP